MVQVVCISKGFASPWHCFVIQSRNNKVSNSMIIFLYVMLMLTSSIENQEKVKKNKSRKMYK